MVGRGNVLLAGPHTPLISPLRMGSVSGAYEGGLQRDMNFRIPGVTTSAFKKTAAYSRLHYFTRPGFLWES